MAATALDFKGQGLTEVPREVFDHAETLEFLDVSGNQIEALPEDLGRLKRLRILFASGNPIRELPRSLGDCRSLRTIGFRGCRLESIAPEALPPSVEAVILTGNQLRELPGEFGRCRRLRKLMLTGNALTVLPESLSGCADLELLRVAANRIATLPAWLPRMPNLAWLALGGNPVCREWSGAEEMEEVPWTDLELHDVLGQGASGVIHRATWRRPVAVKMFKGGLTSDGLPSSEMAASLAAGRHPHLVPVVGRISGHPEGSAGLVMELMDRSFENLAGPPSLQTMTRDIYPEQRRFRMAVVWRTALGVCEAAAHLHARGILHGDLYAHNILWHPGSGQALLSDFGAASGFTPGSEAALALQRLEVRAFGVLLGELLERCPDGRTGLESLHQACLVPDPAERPLFAELVARLSSGQKKPAGS